MPGLPAAFASGAIAMGAFGYLYQPHTWFTAADTARVAPPLSCDEKFKAFASKEEGDGSVSMTMLDFISSISGFGPETVRPTAIVTPKLKKVFRLFDENNDNELSYGEYCVLFTVLSTPADTFATAFHMFARDDKRPGTMSAGDFAEMLNALNSDRTVQLDLDNSGLMTHFFGGDRQKRLGLKQFDEVMGSLRTELHVVEFNAAARQNGRSRLSLPQMRRLVSQRHQLPLSKPFGGAVIDECDGKAVPAASRTRRAAEQEFDDIDDFEMSERGGGGKKKRPAVRQPPGAGSDDFLAVIELLNASTRWTRALEIFSLTHPEQDGCDRKELAQAIKASGVDVTDRQKDLFFKIFDRDDSALLDATEMSDVVAARSSFFAKFVPNFCEPKRNAVQEFVHCMLQK
jgi:Ca2+-binding EF-hand superfamily protein